MSGETRGVGPAALPHLGEEGVVEGERRGVPHWSGGALPLIAQDRWTAPRKWTS